MRRSSAKICREREVDEVVFAYSDVEHAVVMHKASIALAAGADFDVARAVADHAQIALAGDRHLRRAHRRGQVADGTLAGAASQGTQV